jgi:hypothetical protein
LPSNNHLLAVNLCAQEIYKVLIGQRRRQPKAVLVGVERDEAFAAKAKLEPRYIATVAKVETHTRVRRGMKAPFWPAKQGHTSIPENREMRNADHGPRFDPSVSLSWPEH